jgi:hypothetical protein
LRPVAGAHGEPGIEADQQAAAEAWRRLLRQRLVLVVEHAVEGAGRRCAGDGVIERGRQAVDVGPRSLLGRRHLLAGGIARREDCRHRRGAAGHRRARGAEVDQRRLACRVEQDVGGLDVAMQEAGVVDLLQAVEQRPQDALDGGRRQRAGLLQAALQGLALEELHDDVGGAVGLEEIEHPHDARRVLQAGERAALGDEAVAAPGEILRRRRRARQHGGAVLAHGKRQRQVFLDGDLRARAERRGRDR